MNQDIERANYWLRVAGAASLAAGTLFIVVGIAVALRSFNYIGAGVPATNTITVSGEGEVFAVPDLATFSVTVRERAKNVKDAQDAASSKGNAIIQYLKDAGVEEKDIKTADYNVYPQYEYSTAVCREGYCPPGKQTLVGYEVSQTLAVKVRDTDKAGEILAGVTSRGATEVSGLSFTIDDEESLQAEARGKAIEDARAKAHALAKQLKVRLVRIVGFSESGGGYPIPYGMGGDAIAVREAKAVPPEVPIGENKITSNVTVTYEIR